MFTKSTHSNNEPKKVSDRICLRLVRNFDHCDILERVTGVIRVKSKAPEQVNLGTGLLMLSLNLPRQGRHRPPSTWIHFEEVLNPSSGKLLVLESAIYFCIALSVFCSVD